MAVETYLVGGAVRDRLLKLPVAERDWVVVGATPEEMVAAGYTPVGKDFPVFLHPETREEYALARTERKSGHGYTGFEVCADPGVSLEDDLRRRDLTINAMAETPDGTLIDPYGGEEDLANGLLRHVSPAFAEDPVRILRVARFAARFARYGFHVAHGTNALMRSMVDNGEVDYLVPERVWVELQKALETASPWRFFEVLHGCRALGKLFPQLLDHFTGTRSHGHDESVLPVLAAACALSESTEVRFAALACEMDADFGAFCERYRVPNSYRQLAELARRHCSRLHAIAALSAEDIQALLESLDAYRRGGRVGQFLQVCEADARSRDPALREYAAAAILRTALQAAAGVRIDSGGKSGPEIGAAIRQARIEAINKLL